MTDAPDRANQIAAARNQLRSRLTYAGTTLRFSTEQADVWWWLMDSADSNGGPPDPGACWTTPAGRTTCPAWWPARSARQRNGRAWLTTTANLWGALALDKFSAKFRVAAASTAEQPRPHLAARASRHRLVDASPKGGVVATAVARLGATDTLTRDAGRATAGPGLTVQSPVAAIPLKAPLARGLCGDAYRSRRWSRRSRRTRWSRGDVLRVRLEVDAAVGHDLGRGQRPGAGRRHAARVEASAATREIATQSPTGDKAWPTLRANAASTAFRALLRVPAARQARDRVHRAA